MKNLNIINEEIKKFLNEAIAGNSDDFKFSDTFRMYNEQTQEMKAFFYNYSSFSTDYDVDIIDAFITVNWKVGFLVDEKSINDFYINIESVEGQYRLEMRDKQTDEVVQTTDKNIADNQWRFEVDDETIMKVGEGLKIQDISFDFGNNLCTLMFYKSK